MDLGSSPTASARCAGDIAIVAADDLDADAELGEVADRSLRVRLGRIGEEQEAGERHAGFVVVAVVVFRGDLACRHGQDAESFRALGLVERLKPALQVRRERHLGAIAVDRRTDGEHVREGALGDDQVLRRDRRPRPRRSSAACAGSRTESHRSCDSRASSVRRSSPAATMAASSGLSMPVSKAALRKASCRTSADDWPLGIGRIAAERQPLRSACRSCPCRGCPCCRDSRSRRGGGR